VPYSEEKGTMDGRWPEGLTSIESEIRRSGRISDYVFRLPGRARKSLAQIMAGKVRRRLSGAPVY
jgi:hypothetical protein